MATPGTCPHCGAEDHFGSPSFTLWGGMVGHRLINHVVCNGCARGFISTTGEPSTNRIIAYFVVSFSIFFVFFVCFLGPLFASI